MTRARMKIVILTGAEFRHVFFRKFIGLSDRVHVIRTYCEGLEKTLHKVVCRNAGDNKVRLSHLASREQSEEDFFGLFVNNSKDMSNPVFIKKGEINLIKHIDEIISLNPDLIVAYSCSIIKGELLNAFKGRFLNVHLGLSPYYRGSGTNYWPLVNSEPEYVGATFMYIDSGIDTGKIIHQIRAKYFFGDSPSQVGNRLICEMASVYKIIIENFNDIKDDGCYARCSEDSKVYKKSDYTEESVIKLYYNFNYLEEENERSKNAPIIQNSIVCELYK